ncbi:MAG: hypothetical protein LBE04_03985 [Prevotellaceae bacterium]|jgi:hypothetical protein|nr:hypothetical protein [Prevotellaceae bacterium]
MAEMILEVQIQKLEEMKSFLGEFCMLMNDQMEELRNNLHNYRAQGFPTEISDKYEERHYAPARSTVEQMITRIHTLHYNYIDGVIEDLTRAINR